MNDINELTTLPDLDVLARILAGETELYEIIIRRYNPYLFKIGRSYGFSHADSEDIMQETYLKAYLNLSSFENRSSLKTWIVKIFVHECYQRKNILRNIIEKPADTMEFENAQPMFMGNGKGPESITINNELRHVIEQAIRQIPEDYRLVFSLRELAGLTTTETAETLNLTESNVQVRLNRAKTMLRTEIQKMYAPEDIFEFNLIYCGKMVEGVMNRIKHASLA